jgi:hypothetical protein
MPATARKPETVVILWINRASDLDDGVFQYLPGRVYERDNYDPRINEAKYCATIQEMVDYMRENPGWQHPVQLPYALAHRYHLT